MLLEQKQVELLQNPRRSCGFTIIVETALCNNDVNHMPISKPAQDASLHLAELDRYLIESIVDYAVIGTDTAGDITRWNEGARRIFGWTADEMLGQPAARFFTPEDNAIHRPATEMELAALTGRSADERWHIRKNGERFWASGELMPMKGDDGHLLGYVKVLSDRTSQKLAVTDILQQNQNLEEQIAVRSATHELIWTNSPDLLLVVDTTGILRDVNPAWTTLLGWSAAELVGKYVVDLLHPDDIEVSRHALVIASTERLPNVENRYLHKDGSYRWILWTATVEGELIYAIGKDITREKAHVKALQNSEDALRQAQKMEAVGQLTGGLAHDFNNMLAGVIGNLEILGMRLQRGQAEGATKYIDSAMAVANRAAALTHRLLAFSRRQTLDPKQTDVNHLVYEMTDLIRRTIGPGVYLEENFADTVWPVLCDANQLESALLNLAINSRDAMPNGGRLCIGTENTTVDQDSAGSLADVEPGKYVRITVKDSGVGMGPDVLRRALDPFFTTKPGTGLGLSMVYGFVKQSQGFLHIDSRLDAGTTVQIFLPAFFAENAQEPKQESPVKIVSPAEAHTVLLVEDEDSVRNVASEILRGIGYKVMEASDAREALRLFQAAHSVDLLVTDVGLPNGMNGRQLADALREQRPELKVLFITGFADVAAVGEGLATAGMQVLTKPFSMSTFASKVQSMVKDAR